MKEITQEELQRLLKEEAGRTWDMSKGQVFCSSGEAVLCLTWLNFVDRGHLMDGIYSGMEFVNQRCKTRFITERPSGVFLVEPDTTI